MLMLAGRWDDWVPAERLRKHNDENLKQAHHLRTQAEEARGITKVAKTKKLESDFSSNRGSEDRQVTGNATGRGQKRGRDFEIEKVCRSVCFHCFTLSCQPGLKTALSLEKTWFSCHGRSEARAPAPTFGQFLHDIYSLHYQHLFIDRQHFSFGIFFVL